MSREPRRRAVGYIRVSQVGGRGGDSFLSPELQREKIEGWAALRGYDVGRWYEDIDVSGRTGVKRPAFEQMMGDATTGAFDAVIVYRLTRFGRSMKDASASLAKLAASDVGLVSATEDLDTTGATGRLMQNILISLAEWESERIGEEWRATHANRRRRGIAHVPGGAYGYRVEGAQIVGVDEGRAAAVRLAFELRDRGAGYTAIRNRLVAEGFRPMRGGDRISQNVIRKWLSNPLYAGLVRLGDRSLIDGGHDGLVDRELWERVQARHTTVNRQARFRKGLLSGVLVCSGCGYQLEYRPSNRGGAMYACPAGRRANACARGVTIKVERVDEYVTAVLLLSLFAVEDDAGTRTRVRLAQLERDAEKLREALDRLADDRYVLGKITADEYERQAARIGERREAVEVERRELQASAGRASDVLDDAGRVSVPWADMGLDERSRVVRELVHRIVVQPSARQGGSRHRGIDFGQRLEFEWNVPGVRVAFVDAARAALEPLMDGRCEPVELPVAAMCGESPLFPGALDAIRADPASADFFEAGTEAVRTLLATGARE